MAIALVIPDILSTPKTKLPSVVLVNLIATKKYIAASKPRDTYTPHCALKMTAAMNPRIRTISTYMLFLASDDIFLSLDVDYVKLNLTELWIKMKYRPALFCGKT